MSVTVLQGDCRDVLAGLAPASFHACVTDPPYHLSSIVKRFGSADAAPSLDATGAYGRASKGFMGKQWDGGDIAFQPETWAAVHRVLKPGAHLLAFGGTRTFHRMTVAIEDAGFEIRDMVCWLYGSGFPKSHNLGDGWGTALKPAWEPIIVARKAIDGTNVANRAEHGCGGLNIDGCRIESGSRPWREPAVALTGTGGSVGFNMKLNGSRAVDETSLGRWPANVIHDGSDEVEAAFAAYGSAGGAAPASGVTLRDGNESVSRGRFNGLPAGIEPAFHGSVASPARFFYCAKADSSDRAASKHPTVKPVDLIRYLVRLVTPQNGHVLDCFAGSGTTGEAATLEGFDATLIEREAEYVADIKHRMDRWGGHDTPLFASSKPRNHSYQRSIFDPLAAE